MGWIKSFGKILVAIGFGIFVSMVILEIVLRFHVNTSILHTLVYKPWPKENLYTLMPHQKGIWASECYYIDPVKTNSLGFHDVDPMKKVKIAVLGDSYMEALQIPQHEDTSDLLRSLTGVSVMNTGISGFGPIHEYLTYNQFVRSHKPNIVLLFFYTGNDIRDSSCVLNRSGGSVWDSFKACATIDRNGTVTIHQEILPPTSHFNPELKVLVKEYCRSCDFLFYFYSILENKAYQKNKNQQGKYQLPRDLQVYLPPDERWSDAWKITDYFLNKLNAQIKQDGGRLVIVTVPEYGRISKAPLKKMQEAGFQIPSGYDPYRPLRNLEEIAKKDDIPLLELEKYFLQYRDRYHMKAPYFFYRCDGHWNPLGHFIASNVIVKYLLENKLLKGEPDLSGKVDKMLSMSPEEILGKKAYAQIFEGGAYEGQSDINHIIRSTQ